MLECWKHRSHIGQGAASPTLSWAVVTRPLEDCHPLHALLFFIHPKIQGSRKKHVTGQLHTNASASGSWGISGGGQCYSCDSYTWKEKHKRNHQHHRGEVDHGRGNPSLPTVSSECQTSGSVSPRVTESGPLYRKGRSPGPSLRLNPSQKVTDGIFGVPGFHN